MTDVLPYAGFWRRLGAQLADALIFVPVVLALSHVSHDETGDLLIRNLLPFAVIVLLWWHQAATPGKRLFHCHIVDANTGAKPGLGQATLRYAGYFASVFSLGLGFLWILWDPRKQGFHDKISRTVVVYEPDDDASKSFEELARGGR